jgi:hypothetical protein
MHLNPVNGYWRSSMLDPEIFKEIEKMEREDRVYMIFGTVGALTLVVSVLLMLYILFF